jgi:hypothetical protein
MQKKRKSESVRTKPRCSEKHGEKRVPECAKGMLKIHKDLDALLSREGIEAFKMNILPDRQNE